MPDILVKKLLIVDDESSVRDMCARTLQPMGYGTIAVASGEEARPLLKDSFDIILTDLHMSGSINGNELTRLAKVSSSADVIIMTGDPNLDTAIEAMRDGAYDYLIKPFSPATLQNTIQRCTHKRQLSKELAREIALRAELTLAYSDLSRMEKVREIFGQFASPEVAELVLSHPEDFWKRGKRQIVTILFADVRGFTPFANRVSPEEAVSALNEIFGFVLNHVRSEGGILNKFIGDGMMALFGAPIVQEDHAERAACAALKIRQETEEWAASRAAQGLEPLRLGIGLNAGEVVAGCLGTRERTEYSVIGHAVNIASRLEEIAGPGEILIGFETARLLSSRFLFEHRGKSRLQGIHEPVAVVELKG